MLKLLLIAALALTVRADSEADPYYTYYPSYYTGSYYPSTYHYTYPYHYSSSYYSKPYVYRHKREAEADPQLMYMASPYVYSSPYVSTQQYQYVYPTTSYTYATPKVATVQQPTTKVTPVTYAADPNFFFPNIFNNNFGGKASYDQHRYGHGGYGYDDFHYPGHFHINDGWMLWDEDLRDRDSKKTDKFGSNKDGGR